MENISLFFSIFLIFTGASVAATIALFTRQSLLVAYIALGCTLGPWGAGLIVDASLIQQMSTFTVPLK